MQQMYRFGIDGIFRSGNFAVTSSQDKGHHAKVKGRRAKIIMRGTSTEHGEYAVMVWCHHVYRLGEIGWADRHVALTYLTLKSRSELIRDIGKTHQMYHFEIDVMFCWGNIALTSKIQGRNDVCDL